MQSVWSRIWTRVAVSISYDDNHYTTGRDGDYSHCGDSGDSYIEKRRQKSFPEENDE